MVVQETGRKKQQKIRFANMGGKILLKVPRGAAEINAVSTKGWKGKLRR